MRIFRLITAAALTLAVAGGLSAQPKPKKKKVLAIGQVKGFQHDSVSHSLAILEKLGQESGLYDTYIRTDTQLVTKKKLGLNAKNLDFFDAIVFYTTGELDMDDSQKADFASFIKDEGKGFVAVHSANDTFYKWPEYGEITGGYFDGHPWNTFEAPILVEDPSNPMVKQFPRAFSIRDEIYQARNYSREKVRVLMRLDESKLDLTKKGVKRDDKDFAVTWIKNYGKGRVFYSTLGHPEEVWDRKDVQTMYFEALKWVMKLTDCDTTPRPKQ